MKKKAALIMALALAASILTGCGGGDNGSSEKNSSSASGGKNTSDSAGKNSSADSAGDSAESGQNPAEEEPQLTEEESQFTEEAQYQDNPLLEMIPQYLFETACALDGNIDYCYRYIPLSKYKKLREESTRQLDYKFDSIPQADGSVAAIRYSLCVGLVESADVYYVSNTADGKTVEFGGRFYPSDLSEMPAGYALPAIDYTDPTSLIEPLGWSVNDTYTVIDFVTTAFSNGELGECEDRIQGGECSYNGSSSFEWVENMFKKYFTEEMYDACYDAESGTLLGVYVNDNGTCVRKPVSPDEHVPEIVEVDVVTTGIRVDSCEINSELVVRTYLSGAAYGGEDYTVLSAIKKTENGWKISRCNERE